MIRDQLVSLFSSWQDEAQMSQRQMDELEREWRDVVDSREFDDTRFYYWRGRRDGYESAAYELAVGLLGGLPATVTEAS